MSESETFLVGGASGQLGRLVLDALVRAGGRRIIATTRSPGNLAEYAAKGVDVRAADYTTPESLPSAFRGATHMLLISTQAVGARLEHHLNAFKAARKAGVRHIFYTSHSFPDESVSAVAPEHAAMEKAILADGVTYTILRNFLYSENLLLALAEAVTTGTHYGAAGDGRIAYISRRDCAEAAAGAMLNAREHENKIYNITGPELFTNAQMVAAASKALGRKITYVNQSPEEYQARLIANGLPEVIAATFTSFERANGLGDGDLVTDTVERLTGRAPERLQDFLEANVHRINPALTLETLVKQHTS